MTVLVEVVGWAGMAGILGGYLLYMSRRLPLWGFHVVNLLAGAALVMNAWHHGAWPFVALNSAYAVIAALGLIRR